MGQSFEGKAQGFEIGGGPFLATDAILDFGLDVRGAYRINENWRATLALGLFLPQKDELVIGGIFSTSSLTTRYSAFSINGEANYLFPLKGGKITPYALAGLNFITVSVKVEGNAAGVVSGEVAESESGLSFNFGGGCGL
ncbi:MAG: outer membrane beta-barrel protein [Microscillaceae bacterium]|nr:outer membrane beta-barrel protein [Microscillaceae bacterium]